MLRSLHPQRTRSAKPHGLRLTAKGTRLLPSPRGEQTSSEPQFIIAGERDNMSEEKPRFMVELDLWTEANVIGPMFHTDPNQHDWEDAVMRIKKAIRTKVLESYRNGQSAGPRRVYKTR